MSTSASSIRQIRADFDRETIVVYQAYSDRIARAAVEAGRFVAPFSFGRMTWIKPSFLWLMERCGWARKANQTRVLAVRIGREDWEGALARAVLSHHEPRLHPDHAAWRRALASSSVRVQWDPERSLRGAKLAERSIQVGIGRELSRAYAERWVREIRDLTPLTHAIRAHLERGEVARARRKLPPERVYPLPAELAARLGLGAEPRS